MVVRESPGCAMEAVAWTESGQAWASVGKRGQAWASMGKHGQAWTNMDGSRGAKGCSSHPKV